MIPCSKIAHLERLHRPYMPDLNHVMQRNALRLAEVWLDDYKHNVNIAWRLPLQVKQHTGGLDDVNDQIQFAAIARTPKITIFPK